MSNFLLLQRRRRDSLCVLFGQVGFSYSNLVNKSIKKEKKQAAVIGINSVFPLGVQWNTWLVISSNTVRFEIRCISSYTRYTVC